MVSSTSWNNHHQKPSLFATFKAKRVIIYVGRSNLMIKEIKLSFVFNVFVFAYNIATITDHHSIKCIYRIRKDKNVSAFPP